MYVTGLCAWKPPAAAEAGDRGALDRTLRAFTEDRLIAARVH